MIWSKRGNTEKGQWKKLISGSQMYYQIEDLRIPKKKIKKKWSQKTSPTILVAKFMVHQGKKSPFVAAILNKTELSLAIRALIVLKSMVEKN